MLHINVLELKGALLAIQALLKNQRQITVSLNMDNSTAVSYTNHKGGIHSMELVLLTPELWDWCTVRDIYLIAQQRIERVPGRDRLKITPPNNPTISVQMQDRSFCHQIVSSIEAIHQLETRSRSTQLRCSECELERFGGICLPPFNLEQGVLNKALTIPYRADHTFCRIQQIRNRYSQCIHTSPGHSCLLQRYETEGLSKDVANLLVAATRTSTCRCRWCTTRKVNPLSAYFKQHSVLLGRLL